MEEQVVYPNPFVGDELEIMCHRAVLNARKGYLEREIKQYSALFKFATPEMESYKKLQKIVMDMVEDLTEVTEKLKTEI
jgi:hypothetical protein